MVLKERVKKNPSSTFYIGCKDGSGFFFVGNASAFEKDVTKIDRKVRDKYQKRLSSMEEKIEKCQTDLENAEEKLDLLKCEVEKTEEILLQKRSCQKEITSLNFRIRNTKNHWRELNETLRKWVYIPDAEIVEEYPHTIDKPGVTLLIDGKINGQYWSLEEYQGKKGSRI